MNTLTTQRTSLKLALVAPLALAALAAAPHARADNILLAQTTLVTGTVSTVDSFTAPSAGTVTVNLQSLNWPASLNALSFSATSSNQVLASWSGTGLASDVATFDVAAGTYFTHIIATAGGMLDMGLYSMMLTFTPSGSPPPVPLPASGWMLLTGVFVLAGLARAMRPLELAGTAPA
ncbi:MAG TPA: VPLPA-CTERM sorting domain-containing protein [Steroidobacteraceae bacterium]